MNLEEEKIRFCENVRELRLALGLSVIEFSTITHTSVYAIEALNDRRITGELGVSFLFHLARKFQVEPATFLSPMSKQEIELLALQYKNRKMLRCD